LVTFAVPAIRLEFKWGEPATYQASKAGADSTIQRL
jgi:hypothetical protein